jgi:uncharacterized membrane protein
MKTWMSKLFGDNRMNFYGWQVTALLLIALSLVHVLLALKAGGLRATDLLLMAIYFILVGQFGISLQNYCARVAKNIEAENAASTSPPAPPAKPAP